MPNWKWSEPGMFNLGRERATELPGQLLPKRDLGNERGGQGRRFILSCWMFKPLSLLITGLLAAGPLLAQTEPNKSPAAKDADKPPTVKEPGKNPAEQSPPPAPGQSPATAPNV